MVWARGHRSAEHKARSAAFSLASMPTTHLPRLGSRGGAPIWVAHGEGFGLMPSPCTCLVTSSDQCPAHGPLRRLKKLMDKSAWGPREGPDSPPYRKAFAGGHDRGFGAGSDGADPDGYAIFGRFPRGFLSYILRLRLLGDVPRKDILHICSGTLQEAWTVDVRAEARPRVQADGSHLPFRDASFKAVLMDPPYSDAYAKNLYGTENPRPSWLLREAARVVVPGGRIGILHVALPFCLGCDLVRVVPVSTGLGFRIRALTIYQRPGDARQAEAF